MDYGTDTSTPNSDKHTPKKCKSLFGTDVSAPSSMRTACTHLLHAQNLDSFEIVVEWLEDVRIKNLGCKENKSPQSKKEKKTIIFIYLIEVYDIYSFN